MSVLAGVMAIAGLAAGDDAQSDIRLHDLTTARGVFDNRPYQPTAVFAPDDNPIYLWYSADGCTTGTIITSVWFYLETDPPLRFRDASVTVEHPDDWGQFNFRLAPGKQWPIGMYRIELWVGQTRLAQTSFRVATSTTTQSDSRVDQPPAR